MNYIAHRGLKINGAKENTIPAFINAINDSRFAGFECDIRTTKDGVFIIHHDPFIELDIIRQKTYQELKQKHQITRLESVLSLKTDKIMLLEIKEGNLDVDAFISFLDDFEHQNIYLMSFDTHIINKLTKKTKRYHFGVLNYILNSEVEYKHDFICLLSSIVTEEIINRFKALKIEVFIYGLFTDKHLNQFKDVFYITDITR